MRAKEYIATAVRPVYEWLLRVVHSPRTPKPCRLSVRRNAGLRHRRGYLRRRILPKLRQPLGYGRSLISAAEHESTSRADHHRSFHGSALRYGIPYYIGTEVRVVLVVTVVHGIFRYRRHVPLAP